MQIQPYDLIGLFLPLVIDFINVKISNSDLRYLSSLLICGLVGILLNLDKINNWQSLIANVGVVFISAQTVHKIYWSKTDVHDQITKPQ